MKEILLLGLVHSRDDSQRLEKILEHEQPDCITIEASEEQTNYHETEVKRKAKEHLDFLLERGLRKDIYRERLRLVTETFYWELRTGQTYANSHHIPFVYAPIGDVIEELEKLTSLDKIRQKAIKVVQNLNKGIGKSTPQGVNEKYQRAEQFFNGNYQEQEERFIAETQNKNDKRDQPMGDLLLQLNTQAEKIVHLCGIAHCYHSTPRTTVYAYLKNQVPPDTQLIRRTIHHPIYAFTSSSL